MRAKSALRIAGLVACVAFLRAATTFESAVQPVLGTTCKLCHNDRTASGGLNITPFLAPGSLAEQRDGWEVILRKVRSGEMPPKGIPRPPASQMDALVKFVEDELRKADLNS